MKECKNPECPRTEVFTGGFFCPDCGGELADRNKLCEKCQRIINPKDNYCVWCGTRQPDSIKPEEQ